MEGTKGLQAHQGRLEVFRDGRYANRHPFMPPEQEALGLAVNFQVALGTQRGVVLHAVHAGRPPLAQSAVSLLL